MGDGAVEGTTDPSAVGVVEATRFIASSSGAVTSLSIYVDAANRATSFSLGLYSDGGSGPAALLAQGSRTGAESGAWNTVAIGGAAITQGTPYWIARLATAGGDLVTRVNTAVPNPDLVDARNMSALPASFAPGASYPHVTSIYAGTSAVSTPGPTPTPPAPTASPTAAPTSTPSTGSFVCTQVMGYSQTGNWYSQQVSGAFESVVNDARYQLLNFDGGAVWRWADPNYGGWFNAPYSGCASNGGAPDRVIFDVTESFWVDQAWSHAFDDYGGNPDVSVARVAQDIRNMLTTLRAKYPSVRQVYLQAVLGGPGGAVCSINDATGVSHQIRGTWNNSRIEDAIRQAVNGNAVVGPHFEVRTCSDFYDDGQYVGHLDTTAKGPIGQTIGAYYAARP